MIHWPGGLTMNPTIVLGAAVGLIALGYLFFRKVRADYREYGTTTRLSVFLEFAIFALHGMASYLFLDSRLSRVRPASASFLLGVGLMVIGLAGTLAGMARLSWGKAIGRDASGLQVTGLYRFTRNPQLVAYGLLVAGYALWWPSWSGLVWVAVYAVIAHIMVLTEEDHLRRVYGAAYDDYCRRIPRYVGIPRSGGSGAPDHA
jgi:protein-S-isoprenylcysteine O-methyltransferase Ste14